MKRACFALLLILLAASMRAQMHRNADRATRPDNSYELGTVDRINYFNGGVSIALPLGPRYPVNGNLSYQFSVSYATNGWETAEHEVSQDDPNGGPPLKYKVYYSYPLRHMNAGFGWVLTFGRLLLHDLYHPVYLAADGGQHVFYDKLHPNNSNETAYTGTDPQAVFYTRDGSYLRLKRRPAGRYDLELPDGSVHEFEVTGDQARLTKMRDAFGNYVTLAYGVRPDGLYAGSEMWTVSDSTGRTHYVYFRPGRAYQEEFWNAAPDRDIVDQVVLAAFNTAIPATFTFEYDSDPTLGTPPAVKLSRRCPQSEWALPEYTAVSMLKAISMPEQLRYEMQYDRGSQSYCSEITGPNASASGNVKSLRLTTGATVNYTYRAYEYPSGPNTADERLFTTVPGAGTRKVVDADGAILSETEYIPDRYDALDRAQKRKVLSKNGNQTFHAVYHYFSTCAVQSCASSGEYGLPFTRIGASAAGPFVSTEEYAPDAQGQLQKKRTTYVIYERDGPLDDSYDRLPDTNRRLRYTRTDFEDGTFTDVSYSKFDGLGNHRQAVLDGSIGNAQRTAFTNFNPARGTFTVNDAGDDSGDFTMPDVSSPWILHTYDKQRVTERTDQYQTSAVATCFDSTGFLTSRRTYEDFDTNEAPAETPAASSKDLLAIFTRDASGNLLKEQYLGGDVPESAAPLSFPCGTTRGEEAYRIDHTYASGARKSSVSVQTDGTPASHFILDAEIDANTGLVKSVREASTVNGNGTSNGDGLKTDFEYDALGRLRKQTPAGSNRGAKQRFEFTSNGTQVEIHEESSAGVSLRVRTLELDGLGRVKKETRAMPSGVSASRGWTYDRLGRVFSVSAWGSGTSNLTRFEYDPFGRTTKIIAPDGSETTQTYTGVRSSTTTSNVRTGGTADSLVQSPAESTFQYDRFGRLTEVTEPGGAITRYTYDVADHLTTVCAGPTSSGCTQTRRFTYDNRGFLTSETSPELGADGNGTTSYEYDARGNVTRRTTGAQNGDFDVRMAYDRSGRLKSITEAKTVDGVNRILKLFAYGETNSGGEYANGKLKRATRYNWLDAVGFRVSIIEDYTYAGRNGMVSERVTFDRECAGAASSCNAEGAGEQKRKFRQSFTYDQLGALASQTQPMCEFTPCSESVPARTVTNTYDKGWLTDVTWTGAIRSSSLAYHPNGMVSKVTHGNLVEDAIQLDAAGTPRPYLLSTTKVTDPAACTALTFYEQPQSRTVPAGATATLTGRATGQTGSSIGYQWYAGTWPIDTTPVGTNSETLSVSPSATTSYWVKATASAAGCPSSTAASVTATVTICTPPSVSTPPNGLITRGQSKTLTVQAGGSATLQYQWSTVAPNGTTADISGETSSSLNVSPQITTKYRVTVSNGCGTAASAEATVTVVEPPTVPGIVRAAWNGANVAITWGTSTSSVGIKQYEVVRKDGRTFRVNAPASAAFDDQIGLSSVYLYCVRAVDQNDALSACSGFDLALTMSLVDPDEDLEGNPIRGLHVGQLRQAIDLVRNAAGLPNAWSSHAPATGRIEAEHVTEMRARLNEARRALGLPDAVFDKDPVLTEGVTAVDAEHITDLRDGVR